jgi:transposase
VDSMLQMESKRRAAETQASHDRREAPTPTRDNAGRELSAEQRETLSRWAEGDDVRRRGRARIILLCADGLAPEEVSRRLGVAIPTVYKWLRRFARHGSAGLSDLPRSGQPHRLPKEVRAEILRVTREEAPPNGTRWTIRVAARHLGVTQHQVRQVWSDAGLRPHLPDPTTVEA